jgi:hypothetical protein
MVAGAAAAQSPDGHDKQSDGQFTGIVMVTDDLNWYDRFQRPEPPEISGRDRFEAGERGSLVIIFSNAEARGGTAKVTCDITAFDPEGEHLVAEDALCYEGRYAGANILHPALLDLRFEIGPSDPEGKAGFRVTLRDAHSGREVDLEVAFTQGAGA